MRASDTVELNLENVRVSDAQRLGEINHGFIDTLSILDMSGIGIGALAVGLAQGAIEASARYSIDRKSLGVPSKVISRAFSINWRIWRLIWMPPSPSGLSGSLATR